MKAAGLARRSRHARQTGHPPATEIVMLEQIDGLPPGTLGFRAHGQVTAADYEQVLVPDVEAVFALNRKLRMLFVVAPDFTGFDVGAMWDDFMLGIRHISGWDRVALVTDVPWLRTATKATRFLVPADFRLFALAELEPAARWIAEPVDG